MLGCWLGQCYLQAQVLGGGWFEQCYRPPGARQAGVLQVHAPGWQGGVDKMSRSADDDFYSATWVDSPERGGSGDAVTVGLELLPGGASLAELADDTATTEKQKMTKRKEILDKVLDIKAQAPTVSGMIQGIKDGSDETNERYAAISVYGKSTQHKSSSLDHRMDDMTFEQIEKKLKLGTGSSNDSGKSPGVRRIDINSYHIDLRYKARKEFIPELLSAYGLTSASLSITFSSSSFCEGTENWITFSGWSTSAVENAYKETKAFLDYSQGPLPEFVRVTDLHDLLAFSDIEADMSSHNMRPFIKVRKHSVLCSLGTLRCIVGLRPVELILLFGLKSSENDDKSASFRSFKSNVTKQLRRPLNEKDAKLVLDTLHEGLVNIESTQDKKVSAELNAYTVLFSYLGIFFENQAESIDKQARELIEDFESRHWVVSNDHLDLLQKVNKHLQSFELSLAAHKICFEQFLEQPEKRAMMALSVVTEAIYKVAAANTAAVLTIPEMFEASREIERIFLVTWETIKRVELRLGVLDGQIEDAISQVAKAGEDMQTTVLVVNTATTIVGTCIGLGGMITGTSV